MTHLEKYLVELHDARSTGEAVKETSYYPALSNLLNAVKGKGVVMPGKGRTRTRDYTDEEREGLDDAALAAYGARTHDIFLNDAAVWANVPARVWDYTIGGYQVLKKWLSYREHDILGRALTTAEARGVTQAARRICALLLLEPALDANYTRVKADTYDWRGARAD